MRMIFSMILEFSIYSATYLYEIATGNRVLVTFDSVAHNARFITNYVSVESVLRVAVMSYGIGVASCIVLWRRSFVWTCAPIHTVF